MKTLISTVKPATGFCLEIVDSDGKTTLSDKVARVVNSQERLNTYIVVFADGTKATVLYWKRLCD